MNPLDRKQLERLNKAREWSWKKLQSFRQRHMERLRQFVGMHYADDGSPDRVPVNLMELAVSIYVRQLAAHRPQVMASVDDKRFRSFAADFELAMDQLLNEIYFERNVRSAVTSAMFTCGIVKCGMAGSDIEVEGYDGKVGRPFAEPIEFDEWCHDMNAKRWDQTQFQSNRYCLPLDVAKNSGEFDAVERGKLKADQGASSAVTSGDAPDDRTQSISQGSDLGDGEYMDLVELWDVFLPMERLVVTVPSGDGWVKPLRVVEWDGPPCGPYHMLGYGDVPGNVIPLAPAALMTDLHDLANRLFRKLGRQADRQKENTLYQGTSVKDAERLRDANDGEMFHCDNPAGINKIKSGGIDQASLAFLLQVKDMFSWFGGNLDALGGLSPQAKTLGQDELLKSSASQRISDMADKTVTFVEGIIESLAHWERGDPVRERRLLKRVPGHDSGVMVDWTPQYRSGLPEGIGFKIAAYSMQHQTPALKLQGISQVFTQFIAPLMPSLAAEGRTVDVDFLLETVAKLSNIPEVADLVGPAANEAPPPDQQGAGMPASTQRNYTRQSIPGASNSGKADILSRALLGQASQPAEMATLGRATG